MTFPAKNALFPCVCQRLVLAMEGQQIINEDTGVTATGFKLLTSKCLERLIYIESTFLIIIPAEEWNYTSPSFRGFQDISGYLTSGSGTRCPHQLGDLLWWHRSWTAKEHADPARRKALWLFEPIQKILVISAIPSTVQKQYINIGWLSIIEYILNILNRRPSFKAILHHS